MHAENAIALADVATQWHLQMDLQAPAGRGPVRDPEVQRARGRPRGSAGSATTRREPSLFEHVEAAPAAEDVALI